MPWNTECQDRAERLCRELLERGASPQTVLQINRLINACLNEIAPHLKLCTLEKEPSAPKGAPAVREPNGIIVPFRADPKD